MKSADSLSGKMAPKLTVLDRNDQSLSLDQYAGQKKVIYFYPKDDTPGCTIEAKEFSELLKKFKKANAVVIGISGGNSKSKHKFCEKYKLAHEFASDPDYSAAKKWLSFGTKKFMGREYQGIFRNTFVLDQDNINPALKSFDKNSLACRASEIFALAKSSRNKQGTQNLKKYYLTVLSILRFPYLLRQNLVSPRFCSPSKSLSFC